METPLDDHPNIKIKNKGETVTPKQKAYHTNLIQQVHVSLRYQNYYRDNRDEYEELLKSSFNKSSSKDLSVDQLIKLVDYLNMKRADLPTAKPTAATPQQLYKIEQSWGAKARDKSTASMLVFVKRITKKDVSRLADLKKDDARKVIIALEKME